jgi:hypothetical protein
MTPLLMAVKAQFAVPFRNSGSEHQSGKFNNEIADQGPLKMNVECKKI